jgi:hypothetical protein
VSSPRQTDAEPPSAVSEFDYRATVQRPQLDLVRDEGPDTGELRPTQVRPGEMRTPLVTSGPGAPTMQALAPNRRDTEPQESGPDFVESPQELLTPITHRIPTPNAMPALGAAGSSVQKDPFDDQTAVASPSESLLRATRDTSQVGPNPVEEAALEAEFRQVYRDFIETKQACGEAVEGITYDKFSGKLRSNRQQLIARYACKTVKFQVYVKDGKAALKATPVTA